jgi:hypothetical protein
VTKVPTPRQYNAAGATSQAGPEHRHRRRGDHSVEHPRDQQLGQPGREGGVSGDLSVAGFPPYAAGLDGR